MDENRKNLQKKLSGLAPQTKIAIIAFGLLLVTMLVSLNLATDVTAAVINIVIFCIVSSIAVYAINCTIVGKCNTYAWIIGYVVFVNAIIAMLVMMFQLHMQKQIVK